MTATNRIPTPAIPAKLPTGDWGARPSGPVAVGDLIQITTRAGKTWTAAVVSVLGELVAVAVAGASGGVARSTGRCATVRAPAAPTGPRTITVERVGRRSYLRGDTIAVRGLLRDGGCHWDSCERAWWIGKHEAARALAAEAAAAPAEAAPRKRITRCCNPDCGVTLDDYTQRRGYRYCSRECGTDHRMGGQSGYVAGVWHQGSND